MKRAFKEVSLFTPGLASRVDGAGAMTRLPEGHFLGFFAMGFDQRHALGNGVTPGVHFPVPFNKQETWLMIHAMISVGAGRGCGNKNDCVGVGASVGWENLDLANGLRWRIDGDINAPGGPGGRHVRLHHWPITDLRTK